MIVAERTHPTIDVRQFGEFVIILNQALFGVVSDMADIRRKPPFRLTPPERSEA